METRENIFGITRESALLITICLIDLISTLVLITLDLAYEGNPIMDYYLSHGMGVFILAKVAFIVFPIFIAEWSFRYNPIFVKNMLRAAIAAYIFAYVGMNIAVNARPVWAEMSQPYDIEIVQQIENYSSETGHRE